MSGQANVREDVRSVELFLTYLHDLPLPEWVECTRRQRASGTMQDAQAALAAALRACDAQDVFRTREAVLAVLQRFETMDGRLLTRWREPARRLRSETERAALAVLARRYLTVAQFTTLYAAFETVIPSALLFGLDPGIA